MTIPPPRVQNFSYTLTFDVLITLNFTRVVTTCGVITQATAAFIVAAVFAPLLRFDPDRLFISAYRWRLNSAVCRANYGSDPTVVVVFLP